MSEDGQNSGANNKRSAIIRVASTPLGFFVLVILVSEGVLAFTIPFLREDQKSLVVWVILGLIGVLVLFVGFAAIFAPHALRGEDPPNRRGVEQRAPSKGSKVIIKQPSKKKIIRPIHGLINWAPEMTQYIGSVAQVRKIDADAMTVRLDVDGGAHDWAYEWLDFFK